MVGTAAAGDRVYGRIPDDGEVIDHALATTCASCEPGNAVVNRKMLLEALTLAFGEPPTGSRGEGTADPQDPNGPLRDFIDRVLDPYFRPLPLDRLRGIPPGHVEALMEKRGGPEAANRLRKDLAQLFRFAAKCYGFKGQNPASLADGHKVRPGGFHAWTDEEIETYRAAHASGSKARLALELFLGTGAARQDAANMTRANIQGARLCYRRGKTGQEVDLPILPELAVELAQLPPGQMMLLAHGLQGRAYSVSSLGNWFRDMCTVAGLPHCSAHGLRKAGARRLAEVGASEFEVMAFLAHRSAREASRYVAAANRTKLTTSGLAKLGSDGDGNMSNHFQRLDKRQV